MKTLILTLSLFMAITALANDTESPALIITQMRDRGITNITLLKSIQDQFTTLYLNELNEAKKQDRSEYYSHEEYCEIYLETTSARFKKIKGMTVKPPVFYMTTSKKRSLLTAIHDKVQIDCAVTEDHENFEAVLRKSNRMLKGYAVIY